MKQSISKCPICKGSLYISNLQCPDCGLELKNNFKFGIFEQLSTENYNFLLTFLKNRGNLKDLQTDMQISYPTAKKKLDELLVALNLAEITEEETKEIDMRNLSIDYSSNRASEIIKAKLKENGGHVTVYTARGLPCEIYAETDGKSFSSDKLPIKPPYEYAVFDVIVDLLIKQGGQARKGNGRNYKLGDPNCDETTVVGVVAIHSGRKVGESVFDPVFVMAAVLEWADIATNERGYLQLTPKFKANH